MPSFQDRVNFIRSVADLLRGDYKASEYGRIILPLTVLRRLDCVLELTRHFVPERAANPAVQPLPVFSGSSPVHPADQIKQQLPALIADINERFGADLTDEDSLTFSQVEERMIANERLAEEARANDEEHYAVGFEDAWESAVIEVLLSNQRLFARLQQNPAFAAVVKAHIRPRVYQRDRTAACQDTRVKLRVREKEE